MAWEFSLLVVANVTAGSDELIDCLRDRADQGACRFTLVMPATGSGARERLDAALKGMRGAGLDNVEGKVGDPDPIVAVMDMWDPMKFDEIIVSTLPTGSSRWLGLGLPHPPPKAHPGPRALARAPPAAPAREAHRGAGEACGVAPGAPGGARRPAAQAPPADG